MSKPTKNDRPKKPYPDFPLFPHSTGRWCKKIRGKLHYFGYWRGNLEAPWQQALAKYQEQRDDLMAGITPRDLGDGLTVRELANRFMSVKRNLLDTGELSPRTFQDYFGVCALLVKQFGKTRLVSDLAADDFERLRASM